MRGQLELTPTYAAQLDGKILANAHAVGDVDGDGATELLFGSLLGKVSVFKIVGDRLVQWRSCEVNGSVTSICLDNSLVGDNVALNICDVECLNGELITATRDGRVLAYRPDIDHDDPDELAEYTQVAQMEITGEVEKLIVVHSTLSNPDAGPQLLVRCFSGEVFCISDPSEEGPVDKRDIVAWNGPPHDKDGTTFIVGDIELGGERGMAALVSMNGLVSLFSSSGERQWDFQLPEAVVNADRLEMTAAGGDRQDAVRQEFCVGSCLGIRESPTQVDPTIVGISTSGTFFVFRDVQETLIRGLRDSTLVRTRGVRILVLFAYAHSFLVNQADKVRLSPVFAQIDTPEKREVLMKKLRKAFPQSFASNQTAVPTMEELISATLTVPVQL
uniref:Uncharacterized protein n=1 Tax=Phytophthora ramorum TaxID=164328 RepID=H3H570_PHYRM